MSASSDFLGLIRKAQADTEEEIAENQEIIRNFFGDGFSHEYVDNLVVKATNGARTSILVMQQAIIRHIEVGIPLEALLHSLGGDT